MYQQQRQAVKAAMPVNTSYESKVSPDQFLSTLLHAVTAAHMLHLTTRNHCKHVVLEELYEELDDVVDGVIETFMCMSKRVIDFRDEMFKVPKDEVQYVDWLANYIADNKQVLGCDSRIQNQVDEIANIVSKANYKLNFLCG